MNSGHMIGGKYRLVRLLGAGSMGEVWEAVNEFTGGYVALKLLRQQSEDLRERLFREARACGRLTHKNVIAVHDVGETADGEPFLVMQLLSGETLADYLGRKRRLPPLEAAQIARDVARALSAAHKAGVIHRDLKPANIFLHQEEGSEEAVVKVLDFGVSKSLDRSELTRQGVAVGSPAYMSPEQAGASRGLDHRSDLWSLGVVLFQLLTGKRPFEGEALQLFVKILTDPIPHVSDIVPNIDPELANVVSRCLERDVQRRVGSAEELSAMLDRFTQSPSSVANGSKVPPRSPAPPARAPATTLPPELQTISTWAPRDPRAATPPPLPEAPDDPDNAVTQIFDTRAQRPIARFAAAAPPIPANTPAPAVDATALLQFGVTPVAAPPPWPPPGPAPVAFAREEPSRGTNGSATQTYEIAHVQPEVVESPPPSPPVVPIVPPPLQPAPPIAPSAGQATSATLASLIARAKAARLPIIIALSAVGSVLVAVAVWFALSRLSTLPSPKNAVLETPPAPVENAASPPSASTLPDVPPPATVTAPPPSTASTSQVGAMPTQQPVAPPKPEGPRGPATSEPPRPPRERRKQPTNGGKLPGKTAPSHPTWLVGSTGR